MWGTQNDFMLETLFLSVIDTLPAENDLNLFDMMLKGGWLMIPIVMLSIFGVYIGIDRLLYLSRENRTDSGFVRTVIGMVREGKVEEASELCERENTPVSRILKKGIGYRMLSGVELHGVMENAANIEAAALEKGLTAMATVAGAAPMLGFLGTVIGMVQAFYAMAQAGNGVSIGILSKGIYTAMITTVAGLIVGIGGYMFYNIMTSRIDRIVHKMEWVNTEFTEAMYGTEKDKKE